MALYHFHVKMISRSNGNCVRSLAYRAGCKLTDQNTLESFDYKHKEVQYVELILPENAPQWSKNIQKLISEEREKGVQAFSDMAEKHEKRIDGQVYREFEFALQRELTDEQNIILAREFLQDQVAGRGIGVLANFHMDRDEETGERKPHCHAVLLTRQMEENGLSPMKDRRWEEKELIIELREQYAAYTNFHLKLHGHDVRIDHRSYKDQGLDIEPQPKLGKGVKEQEERAFRQEAGKGDKGEEKSHSKSFLQRHTSTEKGQAFHDVQLRNLYRILRRPETILDIVTRNHTTFVWEDVQKKLHQYVDSPELFYRLEDRLRKSSELILLRPERIMPGSGIKEEAIYTTHRMLQSEKSLVTTAESLAAVKSHGVSEALLEQGLTNVQTEMEAKGYCLSADQEKAIRHLIEEGQLKCVLGYAGAGKTTALKACCEIWEEGGYRVYGLAPTRRAAHNLKDSGIESYTLHKFLKSFGEGRCQYHSKSILVLDEGGMVDVGRFDAFLKAVKALGVKAVVIGDGGQLLPVEAGPAFRLVTERVGASRLEEIVRQKEAWQREATVLFGKQETRQALQMYQDRGFIHIVEEKHPSGDTPEEIVKRYEIMARTTGLIFREILREVREKYPGDKDNFKHIMAHQDYEKFKEFRDIQKDAGREILRHAETYRPYLEARWLDPLEMARLFVDKKLDISVQYIKARTNLKKKKLNHLIGIKKPPGQGVEVRDSAKKALIENWKRFYKENPDKTIAMITYSNRDIRDLNNQAREHLKAEGKINRREFTYVIIREGKDDFGRKEIFKEERAFSKGDRIVFTGNKRDLGIINGSMGTILSLDKNKIKVALDKDKTLTFPPKMFSYFDQGWAITIHKTQSATVGKTFLLASHEMNQNLAYVGMTRHEDNVSVYGSSLDFWREEKIGDVLSKSGDKLGAADYLDAESLTALMKEDEKFLEGLLTRLSDELYAMKAVSKSAFTRVAKTFLGNNYEQDRGILMLREALREEQRAETLLYRSEEENFDYFKELKTTRGADEDRGLPAFKHLSSFKIASMGGFLSTPQHQYNENSHISVNLRTEPLIHKDSDKEQGPSFKEDREHRALWAGLFQTELFRTELFRTGYSPGLFRAEYSRAGIELDLKKPQLTTAVIKSEIVPEDFNDMLSTHEPESVKFYVKASLKQDPQKLGIDPHQETPLPSKAQATKTNNTEPAHEEIPLQESLQKKSSFPAAKLDTKTIKDPISPALQAVYEDWKHPAFANATNVRRAFEKGFKIHGEEKAIAYWESKKESLLHLYHQKLAKVENELQSPFLAHLTDHWKDKARQAAKHNPLRVLNLINEKKEDEIYKREREASEGKLNTSQQRQVKKNNLGETYIRFKELSRTIENTLHPPASLREEYKQLGHELSQDKDFMNTLRREDIQAVKTIERMINAHEQSHSLVKDREGPSL